MFMFILVTPMRRRGADNPNPGVTGLSHRRSESSSCSSRPNVASLSIRRCRWHVCSIFSLLISPRRRMSWRASCWSCKRISICKPGVKDMSHKRGRKSSETHFCLEGQHHNFIHSEVARKLLFISPKAHSSTCKVPGLITL